MIVARCTFLFYHIFKNHLGCNIYLRLMYCRKFAVCYLQVSLYLSVREDKLCIILTFVVVSLPSCNIEPGNLDHDDNNIIISNTIDLLRDYERKSLYDG